MEDTYWYILAIWSILRLLEYFWPFGIPSLWYIYFSLFGKFSQAKSGNPEF
jgi:hypothetical protein